MTQRRLKTEGRNYFVPGDSRSVWPFPLFSLVFFPRCRSYAPAQLRQLGYMGKPTKECVRVCRAVQFLYPTTLRCHIINNETKSLRQYLQLYLYLSGMLQVNSNVPELRSPDPDIPW